MSGTYIAVAALAVATVGGAVSYAGQRSAAKAQARAAAESQRLATEANQITSAGNEAARRKEVREAQREARVRRAQILQSAQTGGVGDSSGAIGAAGGVSTVTGAKVSDLSAGLATANAVGANQVSQYGVQNQLSKSLASAQTLSSFGSLLSTVGSAGMGFAKSGGISQFKEK